MGKETEELQMEANQNTSLSPNRGLTPSQIKVLGYISAQTLQEGGISCTKDDLADALHVSKKTVDRAVRRLSKEGYIGVEPCFDENAKQLGNLYFTKTRS